MPDTDVCPSVDSAAEAQEPGVSLCVLASGSRGNCSVIRLRIGSEHRLILVDAGISPRRAAALLGERGLSPDMIDAIIFTHLDTDHAHAGWVSGLPAGACLCIHRRHRGRAHAMGLTVRRTTLFDDVFECGPKGGAIGVRTLLASHDDHGSAALRFTFPSGATLGYATDLGRATEALVDHLYAVDVLAIESNYCPRMQRASARPEYLKRRIMDGAGHLSNEQSAEAVRRIGPRRHIALLHLSEECNQPERALGAHAGAGLPVTVTAQDEPTDWVTICDAGMAAGRPPGLGAPGASVVTVQTGLFGAASA